MVVILPFVDERRLIFPSALELAASFSEEPLLVVSTPVSPTASVLSDTGKSDPLWHAPHKRETKIVVGFLYK